jgi:hypothetical protein
MDLRISTVIKLYKSMQERKKEKKKKRKKYQYSGEILHPFFEI